MKKYMMPVMEELKFVPQDNMTVSGGDVEESTTATTKATTPLDEWD